MNWLNGLHYVGVALTLVSAIGMAIPIIYYIDADIYGKPINWKLIRLSVAVLLATLLLGAFMAGVAA